MKTFFKKNILLLTLSIFIMISAEAQTRITFLDLEKYAGKWFVIATIPTNFDKNWESVTETYTPNSNGKIDIYTTYKKEGDSKDRAVKSKGFPDNESNNLSWKVQFVWPFKADYLIEEINEDYTYVVVGHPKKKFLYIMNRTGLMGNIQLEEIIKRCEKKGYNISKLQKLKLNF